MKNNIGQIVHERRKSLNLTQEQLAEKIDRAPGLIGQIERGETKPSFQTMMRLKETLMFDTNSAYEDDSCSDYSSQELNYLMNGWNEEKQRFLLEFARLINEYFPSKEEPR